MSRWTEEQEARYYASGVWDRRGLYALLAEHPPDKLALRDDAGPIASGELRTRADALATTLEPGAVYAVHMGNTIDHVVAAYAVAAAGAILFELPPDATPTQVEAALARTRATELKGSDPLSAPRGLPEVDTEAVSLLLPPPARRGRRRSSCGR